MTKVILVNYSGGYCGNFLSYLIGESLGVNYNLSVNSDDNSYYFQSGEIETKYIKPFGKLFEIRHGFLKMEDLELITQKKLDASYTYVMNLYRILYDDDNDVFIENIKAYYSELMKNLKNEFFITNIHYAHKYKNLLLQDVFKDSTVIHVGTEKPMYARLFTLLLHAKTKNDRADQILQSKSLSDRELMDDIIKPIPIRSFDKLSISFDMGRLLFENDYAHFGYLEAELSKQIGKEVKLDLEKFKEYANKNINILKEILGDDFLSQSDDVQVKKSLKYIDEQVRV